MSWLEAAEAWKEACLDLIYPPRCAACGQLGRAPFCRLCAEALLPGPPFEIYGASSAWASWEHGGSIALAIWALKSGAHPELGPLLGRGLRPGLARLAEVDAVVPVPPVRRRLVERGYNPPRELSRALPRVRPFWLRRAGEAHPQVGLTRAERLENLEGAFFARSAVEGKTIALVDDVVTTGATATAAVAALLDAGAREVHVLALSRAGH